MNPPKRALPESFSLAFKSNVEVATASKTKKLKSSKKDALSTEKLNSNANDSYQPMKNLWLKILKLFPKKLSKPLKENMTNFTDRYVFFLEILKYYIDMVKDNKEAISVV